jgi:hypothetical protein
VTSDPERVWVEAYTLVLRGLIRMEAAASAGPAPREGSLLAVPYATELAGVCLRYLAAASRSSLADVLEELWKQNANEDSRARRARLGAKFNRFVAQDDDEEGNTT